MSSKQILIDWISRNPGMKVDDITYHTGIGYTKTTDLLRVLRRDKLISAIRMKRGILVYYVGDLPDAHPLVDRQKPVKKAEPKLGNNAFSENRDYRIKPTEIAPGHTVVKFGNEWRANRAQTTRVTPLIGASTLEYI